MAYILILIDNYVLILPRLLIETCRGQSLCDQTCIVHTVWTWSVCGGKMEVGFMWNLMLLLWIVFLQTLLLNPDTRWQIAFFFLIMHPINATLCVPSNQQLWGVMCLEKFLTCEPAVQDTFPAQSIDRCRANVKWIDGCILPWKKTSSLPLFARCPSAHS